MYRFKALKFFLGTSNNNISSQLPKLHSFSSGSFNITLRFCSSEADSCTNLDRTSVLHPVKKINLSNCDSALVTQFNFAMYADKSPLIQKYIDLGVDLHKIEKCPKNAQYLITLSPEKIQPYLLFLKNIGVPDDKLGPIITKNPLIFKEDLDDLQVRVNYLLSKRFDNEMVATIIIRNSKWLSVPVKVIDGKLGWLQQTLKLKGDHIRKMITQAPGIALVKKHCIIKSIFVLKEELGLDEYSLKRVVVSEPLLLKSDPYNLVSTYDYLINNMKVPLALVVKQPKVLTYRKFIFQERHSFLKSLGKAQYSDLLPGYVNLTELVLTTDIEFCDKIAKTSVNLFYDFLKTL